MYLPLIITFVLILGITVFALQNGMPLEVKILTWSIKTSLIAVIFGSALIGGLIVAVFTFPIVIKKHFREKKLTKKSVELEKKTQELENQLTERREIKNIPTVGPQAGTR